MSEANYRRAEEQYAKDVEKQKKVTLLENTLRDAKEFAKVIGEAPTYYLTVAAENKYISVAKKLNSFVEYLESELNK